MKSYIAYVYSGGQRHAKRLDSPIEVLVVERVFIVPDAGSGVRDFETHKPDAIVSRVRLSLAYRGTGICPHGDGRFHPHGVTKG